MKFRYVRLTLFVYHHMNLGKGEKEPVKVLVGEDNGRYFLTAISIPMKKQKWGRLKMTLNDATRYEWE